jgi:hypothetical protein
MSSSILLYSILKNLNDNSTYISSMHTFSSNLYLLSSAPYIYTFLKSFFLLHTTNTFTNNLPIKLLNTTTMNIIMPAMKYASAWAICNLLLSILSTLKKLTAFVI